MKVTSFKHACKLHGHDPEKVLPDVSKFPAKHRKALLATAMMIIIAGAINEGWEPNWNDYNENKYLPWFDMEKSKSNPTGFRFLDSSFSYTGTYSTGGSRLCFKTRELSDYAGKKFVKLYKDMMVVTK